MIRSLILSVACLVIATSCYTCNNGTEDISAPFDKSLPQFYPAGWDGSLPIPQLDANLNCFINVNIPRGYFANVTIYKHMSTPGGYVYYANKAISILQNDDTNPFIFGGSYFRVSIGSENGLTPNSNGFAFKIQWIPFPKVTSKLIDIYAGNAPVAVVPNGQLTTFRGAQSSLMSLMGFMLEDPSTDYLLRQTAIFGGDSFNDDYIGTLEQTLIQNSRRILTTYGNKISVYTFDLANSINYPLFMGQDFQDARVFNLAQGVNCPSTGNCNVKLDGWSGSSLTITDFDGVEIVKDFSIFAGTATINVYENNVSNTTRIATLTNDNYKQQLPLQVKGTMKFYELQGYGTCLMTVTRDVSRAGRI